MQQSFCILIWTASFNILGKMQWSWPQVESSNSNLTTQLVSVTLMHYISHQNQPSVTFGNASLNFKQYVSWITQLLRINIQLEPTEIFGNDLQNYSVHKIMIPFPLSFDNLWILEIQVPCDMVHNVAFSTIKDAIHHLHWDVIQW